MCPTSPPHKEPGSTTSLPPLQAKEIAPSIHPVAPQRSDPVSHTATPLTQAAKLRSGRRNAHRIGVGTGRCRPRCSAAATCCPRRAKGAGCPLCWAIIMRHVPYSVKETVLHGFFRRNPLLRVIPQHRAQQVQPIIHHQVPVLRIHKPTEFLRRVRPDGGSELGGQP